MNVRQNARLSPLGRKRFQHDGRKGLQDRGSRPHALRSPTPDDVAEWINPLRRERLTGAHIAASTGVSPATGAGCRAGRVLSRRRDLEPAGPVRRNEREPPGDMIHLDFTRLGKFGRTGHRIARDRTGQSKSRGGWEYVHVCTDDASRLSFTQIQPDEKAFSAVAHVRAAVAWYGSMGVKLARLTCPSGDISTIGAVQTPR